MILNYNNIIYSKCLFCLHEERERCYSCNTLNSLCVDCSFTQDIPSTIRKLVRYKDGYICEQCALYCLECNTEKTLTYKCSSCRREACEDCLQLQSINVSPSKLAQIFGYKDLCYAISSWVSVCQRCYTPDNITNIQRKEVRILGIIQD